MKFSQIISCLNTIYRVAQIHERRTLRRTLVLALAFLILAKLLAVLAPRLFKAAVDALDAREITAVTTAIWLVVSFVAARLLSTLFAELREFVFAKFTQPCIQALASSTVSNLLQLDFLAFSARRSNEFPALVERGIKGTETFLTLLMFSVIPAAIEVIVVCLLLGYFFDVRFAALVGTSACLFALFTILAVERQDNLHRQTNQASTEFGLRLRESTSNIEVIQVFQTTRHEQARSMEALRLYGDAAIRSQIASLALHIGQAVIVSITLVLCLFLMATNIGAGGATVGSIVMLNMYLLQLYDPLSFLSYSYRHMRDGLIDLEDIAPLQIPAPEIHGVEASASDLQHDLALEVSRASFQYPGGENVIDNLDLSVLHGAFIAVVGPSGAGKSTVAKLIVGVLKPKTGSIKYYGLHHPAASGRLIAYVPQDPQLFTGSSLYNISYGRPGATEAEVIEAARIASADRFISKLSSGYSTLLGDRGALLSSGEKQRIAIARAVLFDANILVVDEGTSALDASTEEEVLNNIKKARSKRTTIIITHRLAAAARADKVIVLDKGKVVQMGSHSELINATGLYARLFESQAWSSGDSGSAVR